MSRKNLQQREGDFGIVRHFHAGCRIVLESSERVGIAKIDNFVEFTELHEIALVLGFASSYSLAASVKSTDSSIVPPEILLQAVPSLSQDISFG